MTKHAYCTIKLCKYSVITPFSVAVSLSALDARILHAIRPIVPFVPFSSSPFFPTSIATSARYGMHGWSTCGRLLEGLEHDVSFLCIAAQLNIDQACTPTYPVWGMYQTEYTELFLGLMLMPEVAVKA